MSCTRTLRKPIGAGSPVCFSHLVAAARNVCSGLVPKALAVRRSLMRFASCSWASVRSPVSELPRIRVPLNTLSKCQIPPRLVRPGGFSNLEARAPLRWGCAEAGCDGPVGSLRGVRRTGYSVCSPDCGRRRRCPSCNAGAASQIDSAGAFRRHRLLAGARLILER
jgi:hypothetical protein